MNGMFRYENNVMGMLLKVSDAVIPLPSESSICIEPEVLARFIFPSDTISCTEI